MLPRIDRILTLCNSGPLCGLNTAKKPGIPVLMYHSISDSPETGHPYYRINTSPRRFSEHMRYLKENDYKVISLFAAMKILSADRDACSRFIVLTFDDGYRDFLEHAWPVLTEFGYTATVFVPTGFIGNSPMFFNGRECLAWSEVRMLSSKGVTFGSHSVSHAKLYELQWNDVRRELQASRQRLEDELSIPVRLFSYPYAFPQEDRQYVSRFRQELREQGYTAAVTTVIGRAQRGSDPLYLKRLPVNEEDDERLFKAKLAGAYDWLAIAQAIARRM